MPRHHHITIALAMLALATPAAVAQPVDSNGAVLTSSLAGTPAPRQDLRSPDARDAAEGRGTFNAPEVTVVKVQHRVPVESNPGTHWGDRGIGAGVVLFLSLLALGGALAAHRRKRTHPMATAS